MNQQAFDAIETAWANHVRARALCPWLTEHTLNSKSFRSARFYQQRHVEYTVLLSKPLTMEDIAEFNKIAEFMNRSFVIHMFAILQEHDVVPYNAEIDTSLDGGAHAKLTKRLRNLFAHGYPDSFDPSNRFHCDAKAAWEPLFPAIPIFHLHIDNVLDPLKNGVLRYVRAKA